MPEPDVTPGATMRVDVWLWSVRMFRARSAATTACRGSHVHVDGQRVKAAAKLGAGHEIRVRTPGGERILRVTALLATRAAGPIDQRCYEDLTPPPDPALRAPVHRRDRGTGRPTQADRRALARLRGRSSHRSPGGDAGPRSALDRDRVRCDRADPARQYMTVANVPRWT